MTAAWRLHDTLLPSVDMDDKGSSTQECFNVLVQVFSKCRGAVNGGASFSGKGRRVENDSELLAWNCQGPD